MEGDKVRPSPTPLGKALVFLNDAKYTLPLTENPTSNFQKTNPKNTLLRHYSFTDNLIIMENVKAVFPEVSGE